MFKKFIYGIIFFNFASFLIFLKRGIGNFFEFIVGVKNLYLEIEMPRNGIIIKQLEEIAEGTVPDFFLPTYLCRSGSTPWYDLLVLAILVRKYQPEVIFEIGSFEGLGSLVLCNNCSNKILYTLDLPPKQIDAVEISSFALKDQSIDSAYNSGKYFNLIRFEVSINHYYADSWTFDYSPFYNSVDFFFIDGAHTYRYVLKDTLNALWCISKGGIIVWHDVKNSQVLKAVSKLIPYLTINHIVHSNICFTIVHSKLKEAIENINKKLRKWEQK